MQVNKYNRTFTIRPDTLDQYVINEQSGYSQLFDGCTDKDILLDIGGNIGATSAYAISRGVGKVIGVEPEPENTELYKLNCPEGILYKGMATNAVGTDKLYVNTGKNKGLHSPRKVRGRPSIDVATFDWRQIADEHQPTLLKIDIEGGEYYLDFNSIPDSVTRIAMEIDIKTWMKLETPFAGPSNKLYNKIKSLFPNTMVDTSKNWTKFAWNMIYIGGR